MNSITFESGEPVTLPFTPRWIVADGTTVKDGGHIVAAFAFRDHADLFVEHAGYHPDRLSVRPLVGTEYTDPEVDA